MDFSKTTDTELQNLLAHYTAINDVKAQEWIVGIADEIRFRIKFPEYAIA